MKKGIYFLTIVLLLNIASTFAQGGTTGPLTWSISDSTLTISGEGAMPNYCGLFSPEQPWEQYKKSINTVVIESGVTNISGCAFYDCNNLTSIIIPNSVKSIGAYSFAICGSLISITIPSSVTSIGALAFSYSGLNSITIPNGIQDIEDDTFSGCVNLASISIPNSVKRIGRDAFSGCNSLTSVTIPNSVTTIVDRAFYYSGLTSILIPKSVANIGDAAFSYCTSMTSIDVESENNSFISENGVLYDKTKNTLLCYPSGRSGDCIIPNSVKIIKNSAFCGSQKLISLTIPNSVTSIGNAAFMGSLSLTSITIPNSVSSIGESAFRGCKSLVSIVIPNNVTSIYDFTFKGCSGITSVVIPNSIKMIGSSAFEGCTSLNSATIPSSVKDIHTYAFANCRNLTSITNLNPVPIAIHFTVFYESNQYACTLQVPTNSVAAYKKADIWKDFNIVGIDVGIETNEIDAVKIYPNPTDGELMIENGEWELKSVEIFDIYGRKLSQIPSSTSLPPASEGDLSHYSLLTTHYSIDISHLPAGIYFVRMKIENDVLIRKIIKH